MIGRAPSELRAADWTLKMHSRMISQPTQRSAGEGQINSLGLALHEKTEIPYVQLIETHFTQMHFTLLTHLFDSDNVSRLLRITRVL